MNHKLSQELTARSQQASGILTFVIADMIVFGMLFVGFMVERSHQTELFNQSAANLDASLGLINTLILITSGLFIVLAIIAAREHKIQAVKVWLLCSFIVGSGFGINKVIEYKDKFEHGITMLTNDFYMYYFALTGVHVLHFLGGMVAIAFLFFKLLKEGSGDSFVNSLGAVGLYWHMVDLLWIFIFPLLYLMGL